MSLDGWSAPPRPDGLSIEVVADAATFHDAMDVMFEGFEMPPEVQPLFEERFRGLLGRTGPTQRTYVARLDGQAVATSLGSVLDGIVAIYNVATVPAARRRGAGAAVTAAAMADAQADGARWAILETSEMGRSVYERLGFRQVARSRSTPATSPARQRDARLIVRAHRWARRGIVTSAEAQPVRPMVPRSTNAPEAALADERAVADDRPAADEHRADRAGDVEALVRRVVARVVEVGRARIVRRAAGSKSTRSASLPTSIAPFRSRPNRRAGVVARTSTIRSTVSPLDDGPPT